MANEYLVNSVDLKAVADTIREKGGTSDALTFPGGFVEAVGAIQASGSYSDSILVELAEKTMTELVSDKITKILAPFLRYQNITLLDLPNCEYLPHDLCNGNTALQEVRLESYTGLNEQCQLAFSNCTALEKVYIPKCERINGQMFKGCKALKRVDTPKATDLRSSAFQESGLEEFICPTVVTGQNSMFRSCLSLTKVDITFSSWRIENALFYGCTSLETFILRSPTLRTLDSTNAFYNTPIASGTGYIYVPSALVEDYKVATNWATFSDQFRAIEDYPEITGG